MNTHPDEIADIKNTRRTGRQGLTLSSLLSPLSSLLSLLSPLPSPLSPLPSPLSPLSSLSPLLSPLTPLSAPLSPLSSPPSPLPSPLSSHPSLLNLQPSTLNPQPSTLNPQPSTLNPQPSTLNPQPLPSLPSPLNPEPSLTNPDPHPLPLALRNTQPQHQVIDGPRRQAEGGEWAGPAGRLVSARVTGHADAEARRSVVTALRVPKAVRYPALHAYRSTGPAGRLGAGRGGERGMEREGRERRERRERVTLTPGNRERQEAPGPRTGRWGLTPNPQSLIPHPSSSYSHIQLSPSTFESENQKIVKR
ncbi:hypothetical protein T484DRAFT_1673656 [Baffinella frigidus]|nr:hypothetical protein T484DRAFT_1673656 [Cryptophyta sp. CCMP2293]